MTRALLLYALISILFLSCGKSPDQRAGALDSAAVNNTLTGNRDSSTMATNAVLDTSAISQLAQTDDGPLVLFGFTDTSGSRILTDPLAISSAPREMLAFAGNPKPRRAALTGAQEASAADNGRQTAANFDNSKGLVYRVSPPPLEADQTVLLVNKSFLETHSPLAVTTVTPPAVLDGKMLVSLGQAKNLKAKRGWRIASLSPNRSVVLVEFYPIRDTVMLSLVLAGENNFVFEDYHGNMTDESSVWRVDDGGEVYPEAFQILAAFDSAGVISMARMWAGPEGGSSSLLQQNGTSFDAVADDYRYWVPE